MSNDSNIVSNKIIINGLLNKYYFEIDLNKRLNVLIGENGIGKTTILKIIRYVSEMDFVSLSRYMFKKITLVHGDQQFDINYSDLIPDPDSICAKLSDLVIDLMEERISILNKGLNEAREKNEFFYSLFMSKCFYNEPISGQILNFIPESCYISRMPGIDFTEEYRNSLIKLDDVQQNVRYFRGSKTSEYIESFIKFISDFIFSEKKVVPVDLVNNIRLLDEKVTKSIISAPEIDALREFINFVINHRDEELELKHEGMHNLKDLIDTQSMIQQTEKRYDSITKFFNENIEISIPNNSDICETVVDLLTKEGSLDVNLILSRYYYPVEFIRQANESAAKHIAPTFNSEMIFGGLDQNFFTTEVMYNIKTYINPVIVSNSVMGKLLEQIDAVHMMEDFDQVRIEAFKQFYKNNIESFLSKRSNKVSQFENIINSIFTSKRVTVRPNGIEITNINYSRKSGDKFDLITNEFNQIRAMDLSAGERKILIMVLISVFLDHTILLIDEPELSISILWQEKLLDMLMDGTKVDHMIVATHSPFIINEKIIKESVTALPMEVIE